MKIKRRLKLFSKNILLLSGVAAAIFVTGGLMNRALAQGSEPVVTDGQRVVNIYDRGAERVIVTKAATVRQALAAANITVQEGRDVVEPGLDTELVAAKYNITIFRARPVTIVDGQVRRQITTAEQTATTIAKAADLSLYPEDTVEISAPHDLLVDGANLVMHVDRATPVILTLYGKRTEVRTRATTVEALLKEKNIRLAASDSMSVDGTAAITPGMTIEIWRNGVQTVTVEEEIDFTIEKIQNADRDASYKEVKQTGQKGVKSVTYEITMQNGRETGRKEISSVTIKEPKKQVEMVGTKFAYTGGPLSEEQITALGMCESGMTATRNSGNGFYGAFQFMPSTWRKVAPAPYNNNLPHEAPLEAQKQAVQTLLSRSSIYTQFPGCAKKMQAQGVL